MLLANGAGKLERLICTEPSEGMRQGWEAGLKKMERRDEAIKVEIVDGVFDKIPVGDASADLVIAAQGSFISASKFAELGSFADRPYLPPTPFGLSDVSANISHLAASFFCTSSAFHWVGSDGASSMKELARVLKPGGNLILIWNLEDPAQPWVRELRSLYEQYEAGKLASPAVRRSIPSGDKGGRLTASLFNRHSSVQVSLMKSPSLTSARD